MMRIICVMVLFLASLGAADWPSFFGPTGDYQTSAGKDFNADLKQWQKVWEKTIGVGYSAVAVDGKRAFSMAHDGNETETLYCFDALSGKVIWRFDYKGPLIDKLHKGGPNATPTIEGDFVYILGKAGQAYCLNKSDGSVVWQQDLLKLMDIKQPAFGFAGSPLIHGDRIFYTSGKAIALNKKSGQQIWMSKTIDQEESSYHPGHATPVVFSYKGIDYMTFYIGTGLEVLKASDGSRVARYNVTAKYHMTAATPVIINDGAAILLSWTRYSALLDFDGASLKARWKSKDYIQSMQNSIYKDGVVYGSSGTHGSKRTSFVAMDVASGKILWEQKGFQWSQLTAVGETIICQDIKGALHSVKLRPDKFELISTIAAGKTRCWTKATYANGHLYLRNNIGRIVCYSPK